MIFNFLYKGSRKLLFLFNKFYSKIAVEIILKGNGVICGKNKKFYGIPFINTTTNSIFMIGNNFTCNSRDFNPIGRNTKTYLVVGPNASLTIGNHVGISNTAIICHKSITIGSFVKIGGGVVIYDTDFHSLDYMDRRNSKLDFENKINSGIVIEDDVFIGAHSIILKGVTIGKGSIIGAGSVITKSIPPFEIWGGNPAKFIRKIDFHKTGMQYAI